MEKLIKQAEQGNSEAQYQLGKLYYSGENVKKNYRVAFEWYKKAAESGHVLAQRMVAEMLLEGSQEIKKNRKLAFYWMQCAAMQDDTIALERLGDMYAKGEGCAKDQNKAIEWYEKSAFKNNPIAQCKLGEIFLPVDLKRSKEWFKMAASLNHPWGYSKLWKISLRIEKNVEDAEHWFQKLYSINEISPWIIGNEYLKESVADKAEEWFEKEFEKDESNLFRIGNAFKYHGFYDKAFEWYMKAAEFGNSLAMVITGYCYKMGKGIKQNTDKAIYWFRKAAELGEIDACYFLGQLYEGYNGATPCYPLSLSYYLQAAKAGHLRAMFNVALLYDGDYEGIEQNYSEAFYWFSKCSEKEEMGSLYYIAKYYEQGLHVEKNTDKAIELFVRVFCNKSPCYDLDALRELIRLNIVKDVFEMNENGGRLNWYIIGSDQAYTSYNDLRKGLESWLKK